MKFNDFLDQVDWCQYLPEFEVACNKYINSKKFRRKYMNNKLLRNLEFRVALGKVFAVKKK